MTAFVVVSMARSGTQLMASMLMQHPDVTWLGETLSGRMHTVTDAQLLAWLQAKPHTGAKLLQEHLSGRPLTLPRLIDGGVRVVVLERVNQVERLRSDAQARMTQRWECGGEPGPLPTVRLDPVWARWWLDVALAFHAQLREVADVWLTYEELVHDPADVMDRVWPVLGVKRIPVTPGTVRQEGRPLQETLTNWGEVAGAVTG